MRLALALIVLTYIVTAFAAQAQGTLMIGSGNVSCGTWTADRRYPAASNALQDEQWVVGFLSGTAFIHLNGDDPLRGLDAQAIWAWIDNYCGAHPLEQVQEATAMLYFTHRHN